MKDTDPDTAAAIRELTITLAILAGACLLGIWLADPGVFASLLAHPL